MRVAIMFAVAVAALTNAHAQANADPQRAVAQARLQADAAQQELSARYAQLWAQLPADARRQLSAQERRWLATGREREQRACEVALGSTVLPALAAERCRAEVVQARIQSLAPAPTQVSLVQ